MLLLIAGIVCLVVSGFLLTMLLPRQGRNQSAWVKSDTGETALALGQFTLLVFGIAFIIKGLTA